MAETQDSGNKIEILKKMLMNKHEISNFPALSNIMKNADIRNIGDNWRIICEKNHIY